MYTSLHPMTPSPKTTPLSRSSSKASRGRSTPFSRPDTNPTSTRPSTLPQLCRAIRCSFAWCCAGPYFPAAVQSFTQPYAYPPLPSLSPWPTAPLSNSSMRLPPLAAQAQGHTSLFLPTAPHSFQVRGVVRLPLQIAPAVAPPLPHTLPNVCSAFSLSTATPMPIPANTIFYVTPRSYAPSSPTGGASLSIIWLSLLSSRCLTGVLTSTPPINNFLQNAPSGWSSGTSVHTGELSSPSSTTGSS